MSDEKTLAIILDGIVIDVVKFNERFAALLMSNPTFVDITENTVGQGWQYDNGKFTAQIDGQSVSIRTGKSSVDQTVKS